jgi:hypothetical protein
MRPETRGEEGMNLLKELFVMCFALYVVALGLWALLSKLAELGGR